MKKSKAQFRCCTFPPAREEVSTNSPSRSLRGRTLLVAERSSASDRKGHLWRTQPVSESMRARYTVLRELILSGRYARVLTPWSSTWPRLTRETRQTRSHCLSNPVRRCTRLGLLQLDLTDSSLERHTTTLNRPHISATPRDETDMQQHFASFF